MSKFFLPSTVTLLGLLLTACSSPINETAQTKEVQEDTIEAKVEEVHPLDQNKYHVVLELMPEEERIALDLPEWTYRTYLSGEDNYNQEVKLFEMPLSNSNGDEYGIAEVFPGETEDLILPSVGQQCGGCVSFTGFYYVVNKYDHSVTQESFAPPSGLEFSRGGPAQNVVYDKVGHQMAYVFQFGDFYENPETYYEEIWVYLFDKKEWLLEDTIGEGNTVFCTLFNNLDSLNGVYFWKEALMVSPDAIDPNPDTMYCGAGY